jgi:hypothetical protein
MVEGKRRRARLATPRALELEDRQEGGVPAKPPFRVGAPRVDWILLRLVILGSFLHTKKKKKH